MAQLIEKELIILGGGKILEDAIDVEATFESLSELRSQFDGLVEIAESDTIQGLNPGFYIAILGYCQDSIKAQMIVNVCNLYMNGVYKKRVWVKSAPNLVFSPLAPPFEGRNYNLLLDAFSEVLYDINLENTLKSKSGGQINKVLVKDDQPVFSQMFGKMKVNFYLGWIHKNRSLVYLSQFQFTQIPRLLSMEPIQCNDKMSGDSIGEMAFNTTESKCQYTDRVVLEYQGYESYGKTISYKKYSFEEVVNYHFGIGDFDLDLLEDMGADGTNEACECRFEISENEVLFEEAHESMGITIKYGEVVFFSGAGA